MGKIIKKKYYSLIILGLVVSFFASYFLIADYLVMSQNSSNSSGLTTISTTEEWSATWGGFSDDLCMNMKIDPNGYIYLVGYTKSYGAGKADLALVKFSTDGNKVWNVTWGGSQYDRGNDLFIGQDGSLYIAGWTSSYGIGSDDIVLVKFYSNGTLAWNVTWGGIGIDYGFDVGLNIDGFIYVCGKTISYGSGGYDFALVKFYMNGTKAWNVTWGGSNPDGCSSLAFGSDGSIYLLGYTRSYGAGNADLALVKFHPNGTLLWNVTWGESGSEYNGNLMVSNDGYIYVVGYTDSYGAGDNDVIFLKFDKDGAKLFNSTWGGPYDDMGRAVIADNYGNIYVGSSTESYGAGNNDFGILNFNSDGNLEWNETWGSVDNEICRAIDISNDDYLYLCGYTNHSTAGGNDFLLVKYKKVFSSHSSQPIPAFELLYALIGLFAISYLIKSKIDFI
ncbi:MAG: hypothetical protein ACTSQI_20385 [Candidatus Helarchaeota archaeon]